ncbi:MAG TPA: RiPP maturation radical SAM C-methyltransferase [Thermoanaerobaculia bacterium]|jgi:magnesium-protoporphyrin IX monomethyl ester (oxidative) cyclase
MERIALINMPFGAVDIPSIALAQLDAVLKARFPGRVDSRVHHLNLDFVPYLGLDLCSIVANTVQANTSGLGDWFFKRAAFPDMADDPEEYLLRHFSGPRGHFELFRDELAPRREEVGGFLDELIDLYGLDQVPLVGFTSMFSQNVAVFAMARRLKERNPGIVTVMGGANCESSMGAVIARNVDWIDFVFSGPALKTFPDFVERLLADGPEACHGIRGVLSRRKLAQAVAGSGPEIGEELDIDVPVRLDYDGYLAELDDKLPGLPVEPKIPFETSRGCWWGERSHCTFCGLNGNTMSYRAMGPEGALAALHDLFDRYADRASEFRSVDNILPREYLTEVLPYLAAPEHVSLFYEVKADLKEREMAVLAAARVTKIQPGIEAMATSTLKLMRKGTTAFQNLRFLKHCLLHGVEAFWNLLVGFPEEPEAVYEKYVRDLPLLLHLQPPSGSFPVRFDRFSPYFTLAKQYGLKLRPSDFYAMVYPFAPGELNDLAYFFVDEHFDADYVRNTAKWLGRLRERIDHWHARWEQRDGRLKPELVFREGRGERVIHDSRSGSAVEHRVGPEGLRVLAALERQHRIPQLAEKLPDLAEAEVERQVLALQQRGLLFEENGFYMSLVVAEREAAAPEAETLPRLQPPRGGAPGPSDLRLR